MLKKLVLLTWLVHVGTSKNGNSETSALIHLRRQLVADYYGHSLGEEQ